MDGATPNAANCELSYEFIPGFRHNWKLLYVKDEQQFYKVNERTKSCDSYKCNLKDCNRRVQIRNEKCFATFGLHNHSTQEGLYTDLRALNEMKRMARSVDNRLKPKQIFDKVKKR